MCNEANAWDPEKTNGCSSAAAATAVSGEMLTTAFSVSANLNCAEPSQAKLCSADQRPVARAWTEGGALCGLKP